MSLRRASATAVLCELACLGAPLGLLAWALREPLAALGRGPWGAQDPWGNGDFVGNFWIWWREAEAWSAGRDWQQATAWPTGAGPLEVFPNRLDAWLALPFFSLERWWVAWNGLAVAALATAVLLGVAAARAAGASRIAAAVGTLLLAASPTLLHELCWGRLASFQFWPGIGALACAAAALRAARPAPAWAAAAGVLLGLQVAAYPFHGLAAGAMTAVVLLLSPGPGPRRTLLLGATAAAAAATCLPWLLAEAPALAAKVAAAPPAGYTALPLAGILGSSGVPERFRCLAPALPIALVALADRRARPWAVAALVGLGLALGPAIAWLPGRPALPSPLSWAMALSPWLARMHHPVREAPLGLAAAAVAAALLLDPAPGRRLRWARGLGLAALLAAALAVLPALGRVTAWDQPGFPPGIGAARWLAGRGDGPVADLLSGEHKAGLSLQPWHRRPLLESIQGYAPTPGAPWGVEHAALADLATALGRGEDPGDEGAAALAGAGLTALLVVDRRPCRPTAPDPGPATAILRARWGEPAYADDEAAVWTLTGAR